MEDYMGRRDTRTGEGWMSESHPIPDDDPCPFALGPLARGVYLTTQPAASAASDRRERKKAAVFTPTRRGGGSKGSRGAGGANLRRNDQGYSDTGGNLSEQKIQDPTGRDALIPYPFPLEIDHQRSENERIEREQEKGNWKLMGRGDTISGEGWKMEGEMSESHPVPTIPDDDPPKYVLRSRAPKLSPPAPPASFNGTRWWSRKAVVLTCGGSLSSLGGTDSLNRYLQCEKACCRGGSKGSLGAPMVRCSNNVSSDSGGGDNGSKEKRQKQLAKLDAFFESKKKEAAESYPTWLAYLAGKPAEWAIQHYKIKEGVQLQLTEMTRASGASTGLGAVIHLQFKALPLTSSTGEPVDGPPTTFYAQVHCTAREEGHASRVFTSESPLLHDPLFELEPSGWIVYPYDCPRCGLDFKDHREMYKKVRPS